MAGLKVYLIKKVVVYDNVSSEHILETCTALMHPRDTLVCLSSTSKEIIIVDVEQYSEIGNRLRQHIIGISYKV